MRVFRLRLVNVGRPREEFLAGRKYLVAPLTLLVPGVLKGSAGPLLYPEEHVSARPGNWNHTPMVVYHPQDAEGAPISARDPEVLNRSYVGLVLRDRYENASRSAEAWFDVENVRRVDETLDPSIRVLPRLEKGEPIEISTGLDLDMVPASEGAVHNGTPYVGIAMNYVPDHLAILPDVKGACSNDDGCGVNVAVKNAGTSHDSDGQFTGDEGDDEEQTDEEKPKPGSKKQKKGKGEKDKKNEAAAAGSAEAASRSAAQADSVKNIHTTLGVETMNKAQMVQFLVGNCDCWKGGEKTLNSLTDEQLKKLVANTKTVIVVNQVKASGKLTGLVANAEGEDVDANVTELATLLGAEVNPEATEETEDDEPAPEPIPAPKNNSRSGTKVKTKSGKPVTVNEYLSQPGMPPEVRSAIVNSMKIERDEKVKLVSAIVANVADDKQRQALGNKYLKYDLADLQEMHALLTANSASGGDDDGFNPPPVFFAAGGGAPPGFRVANAGDEDEDNEVMDLEEVRNEAYKEFPAYNPLKAKQRQPA